MLTILINFTFDITLSENAVISDIVQIINVISDIVQIINVISDTFNGINWF